MAPGSFTNTTLLAVGVAMAILTTAVFGTRSYLGIVKKRQFMWEDGWLIASWVVFMAVTILYLNAGATIFRLQALAAGEIDPYPTVGDDGLKLQKTFFVTTSGLWICLWLVKASLLSLYRRLISNLKLYIIMWWIVVAICLITLAGAITSSMLSCSSMKAWFTPGACNTPRDVKAAYISLWYSYAVDVFTDLLVMLLPLGVIRNLQMQRKRKMSIAALFGLGWVCIAVSTIRVTYLGRDGTNGKFKQPSTSWLALWGIVESGIAVIIGCGPGLYREAKVISSSRNKYYNESNGAGIYGKGATGRSRATGIQPDIDLQSYPRATVQVDNTSSQEELVHNGDNIMVTRSIMVSRNDTNTDSISARSPERAKP